MSYPPSPPGSPAAGPPPQYSPGYPVQPVPAKKSPMKKIVLGVVGGLVALCCGGTLIAAITGGDDKAKEAASTSVAEPTGDAGGPEPPRGEPPTEAAPKTGEPEPNDDEPEPDDGDQDMFGVKVGTALTNESGGDVQTVTVKSVKAYKRGCNSLDMDPKQGYYVVADVLVVQKKGTGSVNPLNFTFVADDGTTANAMSAAFSGCDEPSLDSTNSLRAGQKRAGKIAFDAGMKVGTVEWSSGAFGGSTVGSWATK